jgi:hypothetical protein
MTLPDFERLTQLGICLFQMKGAKDLPISTFRLQFPFPKLAEAIRVGPIVNLLEMLKSGPEFIWVEHTSFHQYSGGSYLITVVWGALFDGFHKHYEFPVFGLDIPFESSRFFQHRSSSKENISGIDISTVLAKDVGKVKMVGRWCWSRCDSSSCFSAPSR